MQMDFFRPAVAALALGALMLGTTPVMAETISYKADLKGASECPRTTAKGPAISTRYMTPGPRR